MYKNLLTLLALAAMLLFVTPTKAGTPVITLSSSTTVTINGPITDESVTKASIEIMALNDSLPKGKAIILFLNTPGGSISAGNNLIELVSGLGRSVVTVTSFAASMGYQLVQAFSTRYILESGTLMSHRAAIGGLGGQVPGEANSRLKWITQAVEEIEVRTSKRVGLSLKDYKELIRDELWLTGNSAVSTNHADKVVKAKCDKSLNGTHAQTFFTMFGPIEVVLHNCPLITGPVSVKASESIMKDSSKFKQVKEEINGYFSKSRFVDDL